MTGSAPQSDGRCGGILLCQWEGAQGESGCKIAPGRRPMNFENGVPVQTGSSFSRKSESRFGVGFGTVSRIVQGILFEAFWMPFRCHLSALGLSWRVFWASLRTLGPARAMLRRVSVFMRNMHFCSVREPYGTVSPTMGHLWAHFGFLFAFSWLLFGCLRGSLAVPW